MTNISLPAEAVDWQEFGDSRILTVCKQLWDSNSRAPIVHCDWNRFNLVVTSCNADDLISKFSTGLKKKKKRKHLLLLTLQSLLFFYCILQNKNTRALFLLGTVVMRGDNTSIRSHKLFNKRDIGCNNEHCTNTGTVQCQHT